MTVKRKTAPRVKYVWQNPKFTQRIVQPTAVGRALEDIKKREGLLTPKLVVQYAADRKSPLHKLFTWDDGLAAQRFREFEARRVITGLRVIVVRKTGPQMQRVYVHAPKTKTTESSFVVISELAPGDVRISKIMETARRDLLAWVSRYAELRTRLPGVFEALDEALLSFE